MFSEYIRGNFTRDKFDKLCLICIKGIMRNVKRINFPPIRIFRALNSLFIRNSREILIPVNLR